MGLFSRGLSFFKNKRTFTADEFVYEFLKLDGNPANTFEMNVDGSTTSKTYQYIVPEGKSIYLDRLVFFGLNTDITPDSFYGLDELTTGTQVSIRDDQDNILLPLAVEQKITRMLDFVGGSDVVGMSTLGNVQTINGGGAMYFFNKAGEELFLKEGHKVQITLNDDLSDIPVLRASVHGVIVNKA